MEKLTQWLNQNPMLNLVFLLLASVSILLSLVLYIKSRKYKRPCFNVRTFQLIEDTVNKIEAVEISYQGERVKNLSLTKFALWNRGNDTVNIHDVASTDPLRIVIDPPAKLLGAELIYASNPANNFKILTNLQTGEVKIEFEYFHTYEGIVAQIYHTGSKDNPIILKGTVKGVSNIIRSSPEDDYYTEVFMRPFQRLVEKINFFPFTLFVGIPVVFMLLPVLLPLIVSDKVAKLIQRPPRVFNLR